MDEEQKNYGRGNRRKKSVQYNFDEISEERWIEQMEI